MTRMVILAPAVADELQSIWEWNAAHYSPDHADAYLDFIKEHIFDLRQREPPGRALAVRPDLRYLLVRRKSSGHGHVVVYRIADIEVHVLHVFHTAQNWQSKIATDQLR